MKTSKPKASKEEAPTQVIERTPPPAVPELPPISDQMQKFLERSFQAYPGRWFYWLENFAADIEAQLVSRGLVIRGEFESKGRKLIRYCGAPPEGTPPALDLKP